MGGICLGGKTTGGNMSGVSKMTGGNMSRREFVGFLELQRLERFCDQ